MTYTASNLITDAYHLSHVLSPQVETMNSIYSEKGLSALNDILAAKSMETNLIPYFREYKVNATPGQEVYFIPGLVDIQSLTYNINTVRYPSQEMGRRDYFTNVRADGISAVPFRWHAERSYEDVLGVMTSGTNLYVYFLPSQAYPFKIWGKFALQEVTFNTDVQTVYERYYRRYLKYELALELCRVWDVAPTPDIVDQLDRIIANLNSMNPPDLSPKRTNMYDDNNSYNYAQINLGMGMTTG